MNHPQMLPDPINGFHACGQQVEILDPMSLRIYVTVPWHPNTPITMDHQCFVSDTVERVMQYLKAEDFVRGRNFNLAIYTHHKP